MWISFNYFSYEAYEPSSTTDGVVYLVSYGPNVFHDPCELDEKYQGEYNWSCTCPWWDKKLKYNGGYCKHIEKHINKRVLFETDKFHDLVWVLDSTVAEKVDAFSQRFYSGHFDDAPNDIVDMLLKVRASIVPYLPIMTVSGVTTTGGLIPAVKVTEEEYEAATGKPYPIIQDKKGQGGTVATHDKTHARYKHKGDVDVAGNVSKGAKKEAERSVGDSIPPAPGKNSRGAKPPMPT